MTNNSSKVSGHLVRGALVGLLVAAPLAGVVYSFLNEARRAQLPIFACWLILGAGLFFTLRSKKAI